MFGYFDWTKIKINWLYWIDEITVYIRVMNEFLRLIFHLKNKRSFIIHSFPTQSIPKQKLFVKIMIFFYLTLLSIYITSAYAMHIYDK